MSNNTRFSVEGALATAGNLQNLTSASAAAAAKGRRRRHRVTMASQLTAVSLLAMVLASVSLSQLASGDTPPGVISSRAAFLRAQRGSRQSARTPNQSEASGSTNQTLVSSISNSSVTANSTAGSSSSSSSSSTTTTTTTSTATTTSTTSTSTSTTARPRVSLVAGRRANNNSTNNGVSGSGEPVQTGVNRSTRTADVFQNGDGFNIFVTNTCERDSMHVNIKTSRAFHGVIHTRNQRSKAVCTVEGTGETEYKLEISHVLNQQDSNYCGVIKAKRESPDDKDLLSVVIAVRVHNKIELSDDKFFLLNCTNRCRRPDCSSGPPQTTLGPNNNNNKLLAGPGDNTNARIVADDAPPESGNGERESVTTPPSGSAEGGRDGARDSDATRRSDCTIYDIPWALTLLWCMGILLLAMIISHCIMCSSVMCRCVKTEVEEREPSVYEDEDDDDDDRGAYGHGVGGRNREDELYNKKNHPLRIDYDNRDIYKTTNNYEPYCLDDDRGDRTRTNNANRTRTKSRR